MSFKQAELWEAVQHPRTISTQTVESMEALLKQYPYFQVLHTLVAKAKHDQQSPDAYAALGRAAVYAPDRRLLRRVFYDELTVVLPESEQNEAPTEPAAASVPPVPPPAPAEAEAVAPPPSEGVAPPETAIVPEMTEPNSEPDDSDALRDELAKTLQNLRASKDQASESLPAADEHPPEEPDAPPGPRSRQQEIIDRFVAANPQISRDVSATNDDKSDLSARSAALQDDIVTENLAEIMLKQGKTDKALSLYEKLGLKYPEKKAYFAQKIEQLKNT